MNKTLFAIFCLFILALESQASECPNGGFGVDILFNNLIAPSTLISRRSCEFLGIEAGERLEVSVTLDHFTLQSLERNSLPVNIMVPRQGSYIFTGQCPSRQSNELVSHSQRLRIIGTVETSDILIIKEHEKCLLNRCPAFGACE